MHLEWKKWRNHLTRPFLPMEPSLEKQDMKPFGSVLRHQTTFFGGKISFLNHIIISFYSTHRNISNDIIIASIRVHMQKLCCSEVDLPIFRPIVWEDVALAPIIHGKWARHMFVM